MNYIVEPGDDLTSRLSSLKSGDNVYIRNGNYDLNPIKPQSGVHIEGESKNVRIKITSDASHIIYLNSNSTIKGCTFEKVGTKTNIIYVLGNKINWSVLNNHFINCTDAVSVMTNKIDYPQSSHGVVKGNTGLDAKLGSITGGMDIEFVDNAFYNHSGDEFFDFNGNAHYNTLENNTFINDTGFTLLDEAIDMIGNNTHNIVRGNRIIGNFQRGIRPSYEASYNLIENNYIEYLPGNTVNAGGIVLWNSGAIPAKIPKNNIVRNNTIVGMSAGIVLKGAQDNTVTDNVISKSSVGIEIAIDTYKGANVISKGNTVSGNHFVGVSKCIDRRDCPDNIITDNICNQEIPPLPAYEFDISDTGKVNGILSQSWQALQGLRK